MLPLVTIEFILTDLMFIYFDINNYNLIYIAYHWIACKGYIVAQVLYITPYWYYLKHN